MRYFTICFVLFCLPLNCMAVSHSAWHVKEIQGSKIFFDHKPPLETHLYELKILGQIKNDRLSPYLILSGVECTECDANTNLYIHNPADGAMQDESLQVSYPYPGKVYDYESNQLLASNRVFLGKCFKSNKSSIIWYGFGINQKGIKQNFMQIARFSKKGITLKLLTKHIPKIQHILADVKKGQCKEIPGIVQYAEP